MKKRLTTEEIDKIITKITNIIISENQVGGMLGAVSFKDTATTPVGSAPQAASTGTVADRDKDKRSAGKGTTTTGTAGKSSAGSSNTGGPKLAVKPTTNPLGIYASGKKNVKESKGSEEPTEPEEVKDIRDEMKDDKEEFPLDLL